MKTPLGCSWDSPPGSVEPGPAFALGELAARGKRGAAGLAARSPNASAGRFPPTCGPCQTQPGTVCARIKAEPVPWVVVFLFGVGQPQQVVGRAGEEKPTVWGARPRGARGMGIPGQLPPGPFKRRPLPAAAAIAIMLCLLLTVLAHLFPAACGGVHERTFVAVKPDGVQRRLVGEIVRRFERKGFKLVALKLVQVWQGLDVVRASRALMGATDPADAAPGTIRGDFCVEERDPRQRLGGERPPRDRALVPQRRAAALGGQRRALAVRVAARPCGPLQFVARPGPQLGPAFVETIK
ncbi:nucleoside diphosphate kinase 3 isoform X4 [Mirounga angustirostris]|uniref:nucleoside diphosphate kinase 3 isoform X4 n=1 Tax=Mirounga angustirostris TaxID=9716 RepID=UPI0023E3D8BC|nr:nucleoside diphosphate kinase 3 isoform X3 [Mirounga angustirostris]